MERGKCHGGWRGERDGDERMWKGGEGREKMVMRKCGGGRVEGGGRGDGDERMWRRGEGG